MSRNIATKLKGRGPTPEQLARIEHNEALFRLPIVHDSPRPVKRRTGPLLVHRDDRVAHNEELARKENRVSRNEAVIQKVAKRVVKDGAKKLRKEANRAARSGMTISEFLPLVIPEGVDVHEIEQLIREERSRTPPNEIGTIRDLYSFNRVHSIEGIKTYLRGIQNRARNAFKITGISLGIVLEKEGDLTLFRPYSNRADILRNKDGDVVPVTIAKRADLERLLDTFNSASFREKMKLPNTKSQAVGIFSVSVRITKLNHAMGAIIPLPDSIVNNESLYSLKGCPNNLCFWGCLALHYGARRDVYLTKARELYKSFYGVGVTKEYAGFDISNQDEMQRVGDKFDLQLRIYENDTDVLEA
jgi:hypothetical protein